MGLDVAARLVAFFCCDRETGEYGPYSTVGGAPLEQRGEELLPGCHYLFRLVDAEGKPINVQVYLGLGDLGGQLWDKDIRALLRIAGVGHPALPELLEGGYQSAAKVAATGAGSGGAAFVATRGAETRADASTVGFFRRNPQKAIEAFRLLVDALATLNDLGITHRNLWPGSIDVDGGPRLRLARFEMSALVSDLFRHNLDSSATGSPLRDLSKNQVPDSLWYLPPERAEFLLHRAAATDLVEHDLSDVFALGMVVAEWFLGPYGADGGLDAPDVTGLPDDQVIEALSAFQRRLRDQLGDAEQIPPDLAGILRSMIERSPGDRPSPDKIVGSLAESYDRIMAMWEPRSGRPLALVFMPKQSTETIERWGWLHYPLTSREGRDELAELIKRDIRGARIVYSPNGADPFVSGGEPPAKREARYVAIGERAAWFCAPYRLQDVYGDEGAPIDTALVVKYVARRDLVWVEKRLTELTRRGTGRPMPEVTMIASDSAPDYMQEQLKDRPPWPPRLPAVTVDDAGIGRTETFKEAIDWLLDFRAAELDARLYPYVLDGSGGQEAVARWDRPRDDKQVVKSALLVKYASSRKLRPDFGDFFGALENDDGGSDVVIIGSRADGSPDRGSVRTEARIVRRDGPDRVVLRRKPNQDPIPAHGWMRPVDDIGSIVSLDRERLARWELFDSKPLLAQLRTPHTIRTLPHRWAHAGAHLKGDGSAAVLEMLVCEPFSAFQGPPGTGKTTIAATAIAAYLDREPTARVLVTAQSNFALDNLALRILAEVGAVDSQSRPIDTGDGPIPLRVASSRATLDDRLTPWLRGNLASRRLRQLAGRAQAALGNLETDPRARPILERWLAMVGTSGDSIGPELADRLRRGANIVFATCATATPALLAISTAPSGAFDWVVVEEAAKAWPTELAIPLVRGFRWTLIGDHFQLPAHRSAEVRQFLNSCANDPHPDMAALWDRRVDYLEAFDLFGSLFRLPAAGKPISATAPVKQLTDQFRMREAIGETVSRVFYPLVPQPAGPSPEDGLPVGSLRTLTSHGLADLSAPDKLIGQELVWLDTAGLTTCYDEPYWSNAGEVDVVSAVLDQMNPFPGRHRDGLDEGRVAVLTPYREQLNLLRQNTRIAPHAYTVHAFQGREADIVVVSLVRDSRDGYHGAEAPVQSRIGHLAKRELVNVLISRARKLLILVGNIEQFQDAGGEADFWPRVCRAVRLYGQVLPAGEAVALGPDRTGRSGRRAR